MMKRCSATLSATVARKELKKGVVQELKQGTLKRRYNAVYFKNNENGSYKNGEPVKNALP